MNKKFFLSIFLAFYSLNGSHLPPTKSSEYVIACWPDNWGCLEALCCTCDDIRCRNICLWNALKKQLECCLYTVYIEENNRINEKRCCKCSCENNHARCIDNGVNFRNYIGRRYDHCRHQQCSCLNTLGQATCDCCGCCIRRKEYPNHPTNDVPPQYTEHMS